MKIKIVCRKDAVNRNGRVPLALRFTHRRQTKTVALGMTVDPSEWNEESQRITCDCPDYRTLQFQLDRVLNEYYKKIRRLEALEIDVNFDTLFEPSQERLDCTVGTYFCRMIERMESVDKYGTASKYRVTYSLWKQFHPQDLRFEEITLSMLRDFELFLRQKGNRDNSIATKFSVLRAVYNRASEEKIFSSEDNPFIRFKLGRLWTSTRKRAISKTDIHRLMALDLSDRAEFARDIFLFSYFMAGINFCDIACLKHSNIRDGRLVYARHKTRKEMNCRINTEAQAIIDKYANTLITDNYIFPILNPTVHKTERQRKDRIKKVLKSVNGELRKIGNELGLVFPLTTYVARHSYASVLKHAGVDVSLISESLGHADLTTTQIYLDSFGNDRIDEAMTHLV
ncbi:MAG: site-specific integrase [Alistipes sp.]|nr:site-specific integrase [Alistipes sp.]